MKKKTPRQLDAEIASVAPAWQRGLDMTTSNYLAKTLKGDVERMNEIRESDRREQMPRIKLEVREGPSRTSNSLRGVYIYVNPPGIAFSNTSTVSHWLQDARIHADAVEPRYVFVAVRPDQDLAAKRAQIEAVLLMRGYRVS